MPSLIHKSRVFHAARGQLSKRISYLNNPNYIEPSSLSSSSKATRIENPKFSESRPFQNKKISELFRSLLVFKLCEFKPLLRHGKKAYDLMTRVIGVKLSDAILRETFFKQFCGGENHDEVVRKLHKLQENNIGGILDYAAEAEIEGDLKKSVPNRNQPAKVFSYDSEESCDAHASKFIQCINAVKDSSVGDGDDLDYQFAAIKVSALGDPMLLSKMSDFVHKTKGLISAFDKSGKGYINHQQFEKIYSSMPNENSSLDLMIRHLDPDGNGSIDSVDWCTAAFTKAPELYLSSTFSSKEIDLIKKMQSRAHYIAKEAFDSDVRLLIDAEQSWIQPAIHIMSLKLQQTYNDVDKKDHPIIFNTYQCYLKGVLDHLESDISRANRSGYHFGAKLVRGAYMEGERRRASEHGYESPIQNSIQDTHECYNAAVHKCLQEMVCADDKGPQSQICLATHNQASIKFAVKLMEDMGLSPHINLESKDKKKKNQSMVSFAQLYGMSDDLTIPLAKTSYKVFKYLPYGEIQKVIPYLLRRLEENGDALGKSSNEIKLILNELRFRLGTAVQKSIRN